MQKYEPAGSDASSSPSAPPSDPLGGANAFRAFFLATPTPMWIEDFSGVARRMEALAKRHGARLFDLLLNDAAEQRVMAGLVRILDANQAAADLLEAGARENLLGDLACGFDDASYAFFAEELVAIARGERRFSVDFRAFSFMGNPRHLRMQWTAAPGHEADLSLVYVTAVDLSGLVAAEEGLKASVAEKEELLRELQHRVRNTLSLVLSLLRWQAQARPAASEQLAASARRVEVLGIVQHSLGSPEHLAYVPLRDCVHTVAFGIKSELGSGAALECSLEGPALKADQAAPLALAIGELAANAFQHGCPDSGCGSVRIQSETLEGGRLRIRVQDSGSGLRAGFDEEGSGGIGLQLARAMAAQLHGTLRFESGADGFAAILEFPLA